MPKTHGPPLFALKSPAMDVQDAFNDLHIIMNDLIIKCEATNRHGIVKKSFLH